MTPNHRASLLMVVGGVLLGAGLGLAALLITGRAPDVLAFLGIGQDGPAALVPGSQSPAPPFSLVELGGETFDLADLRGQPVALNFWATWCLPCKEEMPLLEQAAGRYAGQVHVLAVNNDEPAEDVQAFVDELDLTLPVLLDPGAQVARLYRVRGYPTTFFIDADGVVRYEHIGVLNERQLSGYLEKLGVGQN